MAASWAELSADLGPEPATDAARRAEMVDSDVQDWIVSQIAAGNHPPIDTAQIVTHHAGWTARIRVSTQPVRLGNSSDSVVPICSARTNQRIAWLKDAVLPTPLIGDQIAVQGAVVDYVNQTYANVADISRKAMVQNSRLFDTLRPQDPSIPVAWAKQWVNFIWNNDPTASLANGANTGINYGAWTPTPPGAGNQKPWPSRSEPQAMRVWQPPGGRKGAQLWHDLMHVDVSQKSPYLVFRRVELETPDGQSIDEDIQTIAGGELWPLVATQGPLVLELPGVGAAPPPDNGGSGPGFPGDPTPTTPIGDKPQGGGVNVARLGLVVLGAIGLGALGYYLLEE